MIVCQTEEDALRLAEAFADRDAELSSAVYFCRGVHYYPADLDKGTIIFGPTIDMTDDRGDLFAVFAVHQNAARIVWYFFVFWAKGHPLSPIGMEI